MKQVLLFVTIIILCPSTVAFQRNRSSPKSKASSHRIEQSFAKLSFDLKATVLPVNYNGHDLETLYANLAKRADERLAADYVYAFKADADSTYSPNELILKTRLDARAAILPETTTRVTEVTVKTVRYDSNRSIRYNIVITRSPYNVEINQVVPAEYANGVQPFLGLLLIGKLSASAQHVFSYEENGVVMKNISFDLQTVYLYNTKTGEIILKNPAVEGARLEITPAPEGREEFIIGDRKSKFYYWVGCPDYKNIPLQRRVYFKTTLHAERGGFRAAKNCQ